MWWRGSVVLIAYWESSIGLVGGSFLRCWQHEYAQEEIERNELLRKSRFSIECTEISLRTVKTNAGRHRHEATSGIANDTYRIGRYKDGQVSILVIQNASDHGTDKYPNRNAHRHKTHSGSNPRLTNSIGQNCHTNGMNDSRGGALDQSSHK